MLRYTILCLLALVAAATAACDDDSPSQQAPAATIAASASPEPSVTEPVSDPTRPLPSPTARPAPPGVPTGTETGLPEIDAAIHTVLVADASAFEAQAAFRTLGCTNELGIGGPPKCWQAPGGAAADGTPLDVFTVLSCELEWKTHEELQSYLAAFFESKYELYGVVRFRLDTPLWDEPYLPNPDYGIILASMRADVGEVGTMLGIEDGRIAFIDHVCIGPPAYFLDGGPPYNGQLELILLGPAFH